MAILEQETKPNTDRDRGRAIAKLIAIQREGNVDSHLRTAAIRRIVSLDGNPKLIEQILKGGV